MGWLSDFVDDPIGSVTSGLETVGNAVGDTAQYIGDRVGNDWQQTYNNLDNYWKTGWDMIGDTGQMVGDITRNATSDPLDINSYTDPAQRKLDNFNEQGDDLFGTGGWIKAGANVLTSGNPFSGAGSTGYQLDAAASGNEYSNGRTAGPADLYNLYNLGSGLTDWANKQAVDVTKSVTDPMYHYAEDLTSFENFHRGKLASDILEDPGRAVIGIPYDQYGTNAYNAVFGTDYKPELDRYGGPTQATYQEAAQHGIDTGASQYTGSVARAIANKNIGNWFGGGTTPTTYTENAGNGATLQVTPSDYYNTTDTASTAVSINQGGSQMGDVSVYGGNPTDTMYTPDMGGYDGSLSLPSVDYDQSYGVGNSPYVSGSAPQGYLDQARDFLNSTPGKVVRAGASMVNPNLGAIMNGASGALNGDLGRAAFDTLGSLYMNNRANKANRQYQDQMNSYMDRMNNIYSPNSAYAQQLRQELERKDAASGRRSQYGGRETQLQAMLAEKQAGLAPMQNILTSQAMQGSIAQQQAARNRQVADLKSIFMPQKPGGQSQGSGAGILQGGWDAIKSVWGNL